MTLRITVKPNARDDAVELKPDGSYLVRVTAPAAEGKANDAVVGLLAGYFGVAKSQVEIRSGAGARHKRVEIAGLANHD